MDNQYGAEEDSADWDKNDPYGIDTVETKHGQWHSDEQSEY